MHGVFMMGITSMEIRWRNQHIPAIIQSSYRTEDDIFAAPAVNMDLTWCEVVLCGMVEGTAFLLELSLVIYCRCAKPDGQALLKGNASMLHYTGELFYRK